MTRLLSTLALSLMISLPLAQAGDKSSNDDDDFTAPAEGSQTSNRDPKDKKEVGETQLYFAVRGGAALPSGYSGTAASAGLSMGAEFGNGASLGLRVMVLPNPPEVFGSDTPSVAIGPVLEGGYYYHLAKSVDLFPNGSVGFALGKSPTSGQNQVLPLLTTGVGLRVRSKQGIYVTPEFGVSLTSAAPYGAITVGTKL